MDIELKQTVTQILAFLLMLWILKRFAWKPFMKILDERTENIQSIYKEAETTQEQANDFKKEYEGRLAHINAEGQKIIQHSTLEAQQVATKIEQQARQKADEIIQKAHVQIESDMEKSQEALKTQMIDVAFYAIEKLAHKKLTKEDKDQFTKEVMKEV